MSTTTRDRVERLLAYEAWKLQRGQALPAILAPYKPAERAS